MSTMNSDEDEVHQFTLVRFIHRGRRKAVEQVDIVNSDWLGFDGKTGKCTTQYLDPIITQEDMDLIHSLVKELSPAPESWPRFRVEIVGRAKTYEEALQKLTLLETETHVLTEDTDNDYTVVQKKIENKIKQKQFQEKLGTLKRTLKDKSTDELTKIHKKVTFSEKVQKKPAAPKIKKAIENNVVPTTKNVIEHEEAHDFCMNQDEEALLERREQLYGGIPALATDLEQTEPAIQLGNHDMPDVSEQTDKIDSSVAIETIDCKTDFEFFMMNTLTSMGKDIATIVGKQEVLEDSLNSLRTDLESMKASQEEIASFLLDKKVTKMTDVAIDFGKKFNFSFPLNSLEKFFEFDTELQRSNFLKNDVSIQVTDLFDYELPITRVLQKMLKYFLTKEVAEKFTAVRSARNQSEERTHRFTSTTLYGVMSGVIKYKRAKKLLEINDKILLKSISEAICNVKHWK